MFGYITANISGLSEQEKERYQAYYCGLCDTLGARHGNLGQVTLSYDMTFLLILLSSLYEPDEETLQRRCALHPIKTRAHVRNELAAYVADMNIALAYHKSRDDWADDRSVAGLMQSGLLSRAYAKVEAAYPEKCALIAECLAQIGALEKENCQQVDAPANLTARMLGEIFAWRTDDYWSPALRDVGEALGRFIYMMDAYEDLQEDLRKGRYNPLKALRDEEEYDALCKDALVMMMGECAQTFELLPLVRDVDILRNVLYAGVWTRYAAMEAKKNKDKENEKEAPVA